MIKTKLESIQTTHPHSDRIPLYLKQLLELEKEAKIKIKQSQQLTN